MNFNLEIYRHVDFTAIFFAIPLRLCVSVFTPLVCCGHVSLRCYSISTLIISYSPFSSLRNIFLNSSRVMGRPLIVITLVGA